LMNIMITGSIVGVAYNWLFIAGILVLSMSSTLS
jgi:hypothetical protein